VQRPSRRGAAASGSITQFNGLPAYGDGRPRRPTTTPTASERRASKPAAALHGCSCRFGGTPNEACAIRDRIRGQEGRRHRRPHRASRRRRREVSGRHSRGMATWLFYDKHRPSRWGLHDHPLRPVGGMGGAGRRIQRLGDAIASRSSRPTAARAHPRPRRGRAGGDALRGGQGGGRRCTSPTPRAASSGTRATW
jgi:hypothetical protein